MADSHGHPGKQLEEFMSQLTAGLHSAIDSVGAAVRNRAITPLSGPSSSNVQRAASLKPLASHDCSESGSGDTESLGDLQLNPGADFGSRPESSGARDCSGQGRRTRSHSAGSCTNVESRKSAGAGLGQERSGSAEETGTGGSGPRREAEAHGHGSEEEIDTADRGVFNDEGRGRRSTEALELFNSIWEYELGLSRQRHSLASPATRREHYDVHREQPESSGLAQYSMRRNSGLQGFPSPLYFPSESREALFEDAPDDDGSNTGLQGLQLNRHEMKPWLVSSSSSTADLDDCSMDASASEDMTSEGGRNFVRSRSSSRTEGSRGGPRASRDPGEVLSLVDFLPEAEYDIKLLRRRSEGTDRNSAARRNRVSASSQGVEKIPSAPRRMPPIRSQHDMHLPLWSTFQFRMTQLLTEWDRKMARFREQMLMRFHEMASEARSRIMPDQSQNRGKQSLSVTNMGEPRENPLMSLLGEFGLPSDVSCASGDDQSQNRQKQSPGVTDSDEMRENPLTSLFSELPSDESQMEERLRAAYLRHKLLRSLQSDEGDVRPRVFGVALDGSRRQLEDRGEARGRRKGTRRRMTRSEGAATQLAQNTGRYERGGAHAPSRSGVGVERGSLTRAERLRDALVAELLRLLKKVSLTSSLCYDSRSGESDSAVALRGPGWRAELARGDLLQRGSARRQGSPPLWELQWMGLILQQDTLLIPLHVSPSHVLWWGYNHKRDIHLARAVMSSKAKRWHAESVVTLKPFSCLHWSLRFPNGHFLWSPSQGSSGSLFTEVRGGQLQAYGSEARGTVTLSYDRRLGEWGPTVRQALVLPEGAASLELQQVLATEERGLFQRRLVDARFVRTATSRSKGNLVEVGYEPNDWLRLSCGASTGRQTLSFASVAIGQSQRTSDPRGSRGALSGAPCLRLRVEVPPDNIRRSTFTVEWNHSFDMGSPLDSDSM